MSKRLIIDVSTLVRSEGHATGIVRVSHELTRWAQQHRHDAVFVTRGRETDRLFGIKQQWIEKLLSGTGVIDTSWMPDRLRQTIRIRDWLPLPLVRLLMWVQHPRRTLLLAMERRRLNATTQETALRIARIQAWLMQARDRARYFDRTGKRRAVVPFDVALDGPFEPGRGDILVLTGSDWGETDVNVYERLKREHGVRIVWLCHDIIPLLYPQFYANRVVGSFRDYVERMIPICDLVTISTRAGAADLRKYCETQGWPVPPTRVAGFGSDLAQGVAPDRPPPAGLSPRRYALFVSTIEPRKGHRMLFSIWQRLLAEGVPQTAGFKLVFVGRAGWMVDDLLKEMKEHPSTGKSLLILTGISDEDLATLYRNAAFCLYPSAYEGYGLPIVEAFSYGKPVLASTGGALPEVVGDFSPTLDPTDEQAWHDTIKLWIEQPAEFACFEEKIRAGFRHPTWDQAARTFFGTIDEAIR